MKNAFQIILICILFVTFEINILAQEKNYTKGLPNGYAWTAPLSTRTPVYAKEESLLASLVQRNYLSNIDSSINKRSFPLDCDNEINNLREENKLIDFKDLVIQIDKFYTIKENLIIPVLGAYCCCIKELAGLSAEDIEKYRQDLLTFSLDKSEQ